MEGIRRYLGVNSQQELSEAFDWSRQQRLLSLAHKLLHHRPPRGERPHSKTPQAKVDDQLLQHPNYSIIATLA